MVPVDVLGVRQLPEQEVVVLLLDAVSELVVPISIGAREASAIASAQAGVVPVRPMTHDLLHDVIGALGASVARCEIVRLDGGVFFARVILSTGAAVDSRASDAIALAVRAGAPVVCAAEVIVTAGVEAVDAERAREMERFQRFLDGVEPEDFEV